ncbi:MAG TPA: cysteine rich repeat-containing protein [Smithella sp.]|nr:cysteine rich repeat-containing protein [Smithella sp.]
MKKLFMAICMVMLMLGVASAQEKTGPPMEGRGACKADVEKFCKGVKPGEGRIIACLKGNEDRLSQSCKNEIAKAREKKQQQPKQKPKGSEQEEE